jgi:hypothetical protein
LYHRQDQRRRSDGQLQDYDFYLRWVAKHAVVHLNNKGACRRYWSPQRKIDDPSANLENKYNDDRINKVRKSLGPSQIIALARHLLQTAIEFEFLECSMPRLHTADWKYKPVMDTFANAGAWFELFAELPYDATFRIEALLDCQDFYMEHFQLPDRHIIAVLQTGVGLVNYEGRRQWVMTVEALLYNFNMHCKFMMPCKHQLPNLQTLPFFSHSRGVGVSTDAPKNIIYDSVTTELDKNWLMILFRYFSMPWAMDQIFYKRTKTAIPHYLTVGDLVFWQNALSDLRNNYIMFSPKPTVLPVTKSAMHYRAQDLEIGMFKTGVKDDTGRKVPFLLSLAKKRAPFSILTRYLIINSVTGAHHIF